MDLRETKAGDNRIISRHPWELARLEVVRDIFNKNLTGIENTTILDIGCGDTFFLEKFSEYFPSVTFIGIDIAFDSETISNYQSHLSDKKVKLFDSLEKARPNIDSEVSAIFIFDVVEHIEDDYSFLKNLWTRSFFTEKTLIFITVPAFQGLFTSHDVFLGHYRRYTNASLKQLVNRAGFIEKEKGYFFFFLLFPRIIQLIKEKILGQPKQPTTDIVGWKGGHFITGLLKFILLLDYKITSVLRKSGIKCIGLSNYIVCKKSA